ncbi:hypothetical protein AAVH_30560 [Aphelenchoides avenae]|nr:hypothetical protein AAVH_30560 [Aphelenchus avenae]
MTRLQLALDAKNTQLEEQQRLVEILRDQFHALGGSNDENSGPCEAFSVISSDVKGLSDSQQPGVVEGASADDSGLGSDVVPASPAIEPAATAVIEQSLRNAAANGIAGELSIASVPHGEALSSRAMSETHPVLSRLLRQPLKPLKVAVKRPNFLQLACNKPTKQPRVDPHAQ